MGESYRDLIAMNLVTAIYGATQAFPRDVLFGPPIKSEGRRFLSAVTSQRRNAEWPFSFPTCRRTGFGQIEWD